MCHTSDTYLDEVVLKLLRSCETISFPELNQLCNISSGEERKSSNCVLLPNVIDLGNKIMYTTQSVPIYSTIHVYMSNSGKSRTLGLIESNMCWHRGRRVGSIIQCYSKHVRTPTSELDK